DRGSTRIGGGDPLVARPVAHRRDDLVERPAQIDRGRPGREQCRMGALDAIVRGVLAQREAHAVGGGRADQRPAADHHGGDRSRPARGRPEAPGLEAMRQPGLVDHADRPSVRLEPDRAPGFAVDLHESLMLRPSPYDGGARLYNLPPGTAPALPLPTNSEPCGSAPPPPPPPPPRGEGARRAPRDRAPAAVTPRPPPPHASPRP